MLSLLRKAAVPDRCSRLLCTHAQRASSPVWGSGVQHAHGGAHSWARFALAGTGLLAVPGAAWLTCTHTTDSSPLPHAHADANADATPPPAGGTQRMNATIEYPASFVAELRLRKSANGPEGLVVALKEGQPAPVSEPTPPAPKPKDTKKDAPPAKPAAATKPAAPAAPKSQAELYYAHMLPQRRVFLSGRIDDSMANELVRAVGQLLYLEAKDPEAPITLLINSQGGSVIAGFAIYDIMQSIAAPVHTVCVGQAASMAAILLAAGEAGHRWAMPNSHIMIHQASHAMVGKTTDVLIRARRAEQVADQLASVLASHCRRSRDEVLEALKDDNHQSPEEALSFGIVDHIGSPLHSKISLSKVEAKTAPTKAEAKTTKTAGNANIGRKGSASSGP